MTNPNRPGVFKHIYQKWTGSNIDYDLTSYRSVLTEVQRYQSELEACDEVELKRRSGQMQQKAKTTPPVDSLLPEAYALVKEAVHRVLRCS
jgi:preprotein translocase subunit SecA